MSGMEYYPVDKILDNPQKCANLITNSNCEESAKPMYMNGRYCGFWLCDFHADLYMKEKYLERELRAQRMQMITKAQWVINLLCNCPGCKKELIDLLDAPDFWDSRQLGVGEHGTERSKGVEVVCPECGHEFTVDCEY